MADLDNTRVWSKGTGTAKIQPTTNDPVVMWDHPLTDGESYSFQFLVTSILDTATDLADGYQTGTLLVFAIWDGDAGVLDHTIGSELININGGASAEWDAIENGGNIEVTAVKTNGTGTLHMLSCIAGHKTEFATDLSNPA